MSDKPNYVETVKRLAALIREDHPETPEEVDAYLRANGYDPEKLIAKFRPELNGLIDEAQKRLNGNKTYDLSHITEVAESGWNGISAGTKNSIDKAKAAGKPVEVIS